MKVNSECFEDVEYDPSTRVMRVKFTHGGEYDVLDVSPEKHAAFMAADSKGKHYQIHIRHSHDHRKV